MLKDELSKIFSYLTVYFVSGKVVLSFQFMTLRHDGLDATLVCLQLGFECRMLLNFTL